MSSDEPQIKYQEVSPFQISEGFTPTRSHKMEPVKTGRIFMAAVAANLSAFAVGTCLGWTSPIAPKLKSDDTSDSPLDHKIDSTDDAWIASIVALGALVVSYAAGPLADIIGRKWVLLSSSVLLVVSFIVLMIAPEVWVIVLARALQGFATGFVMTVQPMYLSEISTDEIRGATGSLMQLFIVSGVLYTYVIGPYVSYQALQWFCLAVPIVFAATFIFMPESPYYYIANGRQEEASKALQFLRGQSEETVKEALVLIENFILETSQQKGRVMDIFKLAGNRKAFIISALLLAFQQLSGNTAVLFNTQTIFATANTGVDAAIGAIIIGIVQVVASALTPLMVDRLGRKIILLTCSGIMCIVLFALGAYFYIELNGQDTSDIMWLPLTSLIIYMITYSISFGPLPWVVMAEIFPANVKAVASSLAASICLFTGFIISFFFPLLSTLGTFYIFWLFAISCLIAFFFILFVVFETKGLSLQEIQNKLNKKDLN
ncbi:facilitated trehalose transporter Tret1 isoform X1 [Lucilia sericata]|uniref:facilitated trehalose transporter Tret1 isoform X1 n=1 Tax=Lucilia sericata TaxID=13632 RepID=UPI0018A7EE7D|nr:facilitated trehalose transporter Tret1 isoform X1 [Lucilia sericata]XP_037811300.1 facilitated trehalose transporter Tret1 isoform X1 [Lucilia sericata]XP_037811301.1 facilitated trehalose transporter Tret1 isoform X1 [Lucilia sericata]XP_037811302.1 facilitated trehalose transporter Tret1 isoform X1 [Lucilia sericata]XP_037811303.1 facilitated trehalose transporter Tret1 isoform X1 [Lucilia sericata]